MSTHPEVQIAAGKSVDDVLTAFRGSVNQPGTIFSTEHWLVPKLDQLKRLLTDPITEDEAQALLDVLHQRHWMRDLLDWLDKRPVSWADFFTYRDNLKQEDLRKAADERERRRAAGLDPYLNFKLVPDDFHPKLSDACPDCGSSDWKPIGYGLPTEDGIEDARRGHYVLGGCVLQDAKRYCLACFNRWPTKPNMKKPTGRPEWVERKVAETRSEYAELSALADQPPSPEEPHVERAWARIDGRVSFLVSFGGKKARVTKSLQYSRLGGAPEYDANVLGICDPRDVCKMCDLAALAVVRFERTHEPEKHNLYNDWDIVQAHWRAFDRRWDGESYRRERVREKRQKLSRLLKLARSVPEKLPRVFSLRSDGNPKVYRVRFPWGVARVRSYTWQSELPDYDCRDLCRKAEDAELAGDLACAAVMLYEFPKLAGTSS
ncbi:MAG: hypothetical protein P4L56_30890 [Candidatus Sulfopaludibacter sp.]|nr:hypothetical protein [Candidatus Sulfopaludibacter sp.]